VAAISTDDREALTIIVFHTTILGADGGTTFSQKVHTCLHIQELSDATKEATMSSSSRSSTPFWKTNGGITIIVALIGSVGLIIAALIGNSQSNNPPVIVNPNGSPPPILQPAGKIESPKSGDPVSRSFEVKGTLSGIPPDHHVWLAVQIGNLLWPKDPEIPSQNQYWTQKVAEGGSPPGGKFSLVLFMVDAAGNKEIEKWFSDGQASSSSVVS